MRVLAALSSALVVFAFAPEALAHGGQFGHARGPSRYRAPSIACDCGRVDCPACSAKGLADGAGLTKRTTRVETTRSWGELAEVRVTAEFETTQEQGFLEAALRVERGSLLAVTGGTVSCVEHDLVAGLAAAPTARRDYLWERDRRLRDPMLVQRESASVVSMRVFPISAKGTTRATLTAFTLLPGTGAASPRFYRTRDRVLAVLPRTAESERDADFVDAAGGRVLVFLSEAACRARWEGAAQHAYWVPCVPALEAAVHGKGDAAVTEGTALVALPANSHAPTDLFVGPAEKAPYVEVGIPPGLSEPSDPAPPPPPPMPLGPVITPTEVPPPRTPVVTQP